MDILTLFRDYGWGVAIILYFAPKLWQFVTERYYPHKVAEKKREAERQDTTLQAERERQALYLKSQIDRDEREFTHRKEIDNRIAAAIEGVQQTSQQMTLAITVNNERITQLISAHSRHDNFTIGAHVEVKEKMEQLESMMDTRNQVAELRRQLHDTQEKIKVVGKKGGQPE